MFREFALTAREKGVSELYRGFYSRAVHCLISDLIYYYSYTYLTNRKLESLMMEVAKMKKKDAPASLELDKDGTIHCVLEDTSVGVEERDAQLKAAVISRLSLDDNPNKVCLFKVTAEQLERVSIVGSMITFYLRRRDDDPLRPVGVVGR